MNYVILGIIIVIIIILMIIIYLLFLNNKNIKRIQQQILKIEVKEEEEKEKKEIIKEPQIGLFRFPQLVLNKNNINNSTDINPNSCDDDLKMDYDEVNLNLIKKNIYDKLDKSTEQPKFNIYEEAPNTLKYVTTYINLPGYKGYNIEDTNRFELKKNNSGLINYVKLKDTETFKPHNSVIYP